MDLRSIVAAAPEVALRGTVLRLVQQQGINSLEPLVDNLEQLARLEAMVASSKPPLPAAGPDTPSHPLLTTPFRYPPLRHGSRFGSRQYRGMFYGSRSRSGCLVEGAYYSPTGPPNSSAPGCAIKELGPLNTSAPAPGMRWCKWVSSHRRCFSPLPSIRWRSALKSRPNTRLSSVTTTASCIVLSASCF